MEDLKSPKAILTMHVRQAHTHTLALFPAPNHKSRSSHQTFSKWFSSRFLVVLSPYVRDTESGHERRNTGWSSHRLRGQAGDTEACVLTTIRSRQSGQELIHSHNHNLPHRAAPTAKARPIPPSFHLLSFLRKSNTRQGLSPSDARLGWKVISPRHRSYLAGS